LNYKITLYKKVTQLVSADSINHAETMAQKVVQRMCSGDAEFEPSSGMLHSIRVQDEIKAEPDKELQGDLVEEAAEPVSSVQD